MTRLILTPIASDATRVAALLSGDVDFIAPVPANDLARLKKDRDLNVAAMAGTRIITFQLNQERNKAFADPRVRLAAVYAINNRAIASKLMKGLAAVAGQQSPPGYAGHNPALKPRYDLAKARALMKEAGYENGFRRA